MNTIDYLPLWLVFVIFVGMALLCVEGGFRLGKRRRDRNAHEPQGAVGTMVAATLGLLAFLLTFTFNIAASRFDDRRTAVLDEANAIGTTYLRADFLSQPGKDRVRKLLREYVSVRLRPVDQIDKILADSNTIQTELWAEASAASQESPTPICALFINSLNEVIDMHSKRVAVGLYARVPQIVWACLLAVTITSMTGVGYSCGLAGSRSWLATLVLLTAFGLVIILVADLDRPREGMIRTPQQPMIDLSKKLGQP
jgi:hypothetical protein